MTLLDFLTSPWWLGIGAVCALVLAVSAYRNGTFEPQSPGSATVRDEAIDRTVHAVMLVLAFGITAVAWPLFALALAFNYWTVRQEARDNEASDAAEW